MIRYAAVAMAAALLGATADLNSANAQTPNSPVLQNAWLGPGFVVAINGAGGSDGSFWGAALAWTPNNPRFSLSGGLGYLSRSGFGSSAGGGVRATVALGSLPSEFGLAAFVGIGGGAATRDSGLRVNGFVFPDSLTSTTEVPLGVSVGWRHSISSSQSVSVYTSPAVLFIAGGTKSQAIFRGSLGVDLGITESFGVTGGFDFGQTRPRGFGGPSNVLFAVGLSYAFGRG